MKIKTKFFHSLSLRGFSSQEAAKKDYEKKLAAQQKDKISAEVLAAQANFMRMNATSISDIPKLLVESVLVLFGAILQIEKFELKRGSFAANGGENTGCINDMHCAPIGEKGCDWQNTKYYPGYTGSISGQIISSSREERSFSSMVGNYYDRSIKGFYSGSGGGGNNDFRYDISIFIQDYPIIYRKYLRFQELSEARRTVINETNRLLAIRRGDVDALVDNDEKIIQYDAEVSLLKKKIQDLQENRNNRVAQLNTSVSPIILGEKFRYDAIAFESLKLDLNF